MIGLKRPAGAVAIAGILLLVDVVVRLLVGGPYLGATAFLLASCGLALLGFLPPELARASLRVAALPAVALTSFSILLTTVSIVGIPLSEVSIRLAVALLVASCAVADQMSARRVDTTKPAWTAKREALSLAVLTAIVGFALASAWDIVDPFPPPGTDWAYYLLYSNEVEGQQALLVADSLSGDQGLFSASPAVGALYGGALILDGIDSRSLTSGMTLVAVLGPLGVYALVGALWGASGGLAAAAVYAVAPIRLDPLYWYGLHTQLALAVLPLVLLSLGLLYRGRRDRRTIGLLGFSLAGVAVVHATSAFVVGILIAIVLVAATFIASVNGRMDRAFLRCRFSWRGGVMLPVIAGVAVAGVVGAGVGVHIRQQAADLGEPVSYRFFDSDWLDRDTLLSYYSWSFLALVAVSAVLVAATPRLRRDPALLTAATLALASIVVSQLWRVHLPFEYRRAVYYLGLAMVVLIGVAATRFRGQAWPLVVYALVVVYIAHGSVGLRLPERLLTSSDRPSPVVDALDGLRRELDRDGVKGVVVADRCLQSVVRFVLGRPTISALDEWQVGFVNQVPLARKAAAIIAGGPRGKRLAKNLGVRYIVVDPKCTPSPAAGLGGVAVVQKEQIVAIRLPSS